MKCIDVRYGSVCRKGFFKRTISQSDEAFHTFELKEIKSMLKAYQREEWPEYTYYGDIPTVGGNSFRVDFNVPAVTYASSSSLAARSAAIQIGCKRYTKEEVNAAIKAFL